jgi:hypothetical protein
MKQQFDVETLVPGIPFDWPMVEGHNAFVIESRQPFSPYYDSTGEWEYGINIGVFKAPTDNDICHWRAGTQRVAIVEVYKYRINKRGLRTSQTIHHKEIFFNKKDPRPPSNLTLLLITETEGRSNWRRIR